MKNLQMSNEVIDWSAHLTGPRPADIKFIRESWLASYRNSPWAGCIANNLYADAVGQTIDQLLFRGAKLLTIRNFANPELIVAWVCFESLPKANEVVVHAIYTKPVYRKQGAAKTLLQRVLGAHNTDRFFITFRTGYSKYLKGATYRPEIARRKSNGKSSNEK